MNGALGVMAKQRSYRVPEALQKSTEEDPSALSSSSINQTAPLGCGTTQPGVSVQWLSPPQNELSGGEQGLFRPSTDTI